MIECLDRQGMVILLAVLAAQVKQEIAFLERAAAGIVAGQVNAYADLALLALEAADQGKGYYVRDNGCLYIWDGKSFPDAGGGIEFRGLQGLPGQDGGMGPQGLIGPNGVTFIPHVDGNCNLTWTNDGGLPNPPAVNLRGLQGIPGDVGDKSGPVTWAPSGWPPDCMEFSRIGNIVQWRVDTGATIVPTAASTNRIPLGFRPSRPLYFFCAMSQNGKPSFIRIDPDGTVQGSQQNTAAIQWAMPWVTEDPHPAKE